MLVGPDQEMTLLRTLAEIDVRERRQVYWAARASFLGGPDQVSAFDAVFERFWGGLSLEPGGRISEHGESDARLEGPQHGGESLPQFRRDGRASALVDGDSARASREVPSAAGDDRRGHDANRRGVLAAWSPEELRTSGDLDFEPDELIAVRRLAEELTRATPERLSRRPRPSRRSGRLDLRRTLRGSLRSEGELLRPAYVERSRRPRRLLLICDVSGSMERYSRTLLGSMQAAVAAGIRAEAFVFATSLTRLTGKLSARNVARALANARAEVTDWSGGTRIGSALGEFNRYWSRLGLARGSIVVIVSDGWDRGDPDVLGAELERIRQQSRRLIWLNPRPVELDVQPLAIGMRAALPYVDDFVPGHDARAIVGLASLISGLGTNRPLRRQRYPRSGPGISGSLARGERA